MTKVFSDGELCMTLLLLLIMHVSGVQIFERKSDLSVILVAQMFIGLKAKRGSRQISLHKCRTNTFFIRHICFYLYITSNEKSAVSSDMPVMPCTCNSIVTLVPLASGSRCVS